MPHRSWTLLGSQDVSDHRIFRLRHDRYRFEPTGVERDFVVLDSPSWVNVVPLTPEGKVVLIRQYRHGIQDVTIEVPGGVIDRGELPEHAAVRELQEETGYVAERIRLLARVLPNPAIQNNWCYLYVAEGCRPTGQTNFDPFEVIDVVEHPLDEIPTLIRDGRICHCMVIAAFAMLGAVSDGPNASSPRTQ
jgi:ADP-ribose pyrophosphatase